VRHIDRASEPERLFIRSYEAELAGKRDETIRQLEELIRRYPDEKGAYNQLARLYLNAHDTPHVIQTYTRLLEVDPLDKLAWNGLAYAYETAGRSDKSLEAINKYVSLAPDEANPYDTRGDLYAAHGRLDEAMASYREALARSAAYSASRTKLGYLLLERRQYAAADSCFQYMAASEEAGVRAQGRFLLALRPAFQGRLGEALQLLDQGLASDEMEKQQMHEFSKLALTTAICVERKDLVRARDAADRFAALAKVALPKDPLRGRDLQIFVLVQGEEIGRAETLLAEIRKDLSPRDSTRMGSYHLLEAAVRGARGDTARALAAVRQAPEGTTCAQAFWTGYSYMRLGRHEQAVRGLERALTLYDESRLGLGIQMVKAHYDLGSAYERSGWKEKAAQQYREFLAYWENGDPGLPGVKEAKEGLARLTPGT
jgi:tetratricopeptide (TPR) repeat protein